VSTSENRIIVDGGVVTLRDGTAMQLDFRGVTIKLGPKAFLQDCAVRADCTIEVIP
jgi:hypothetical protein